VFSVVCENRCVPTKKPRASAELRAKALEMKKNGFTVEAIARALGVSKNSIYNWQQWQCKGRAAGLADKTPERPSALSDPDRMESARLIETTTPEDHGFDSRLWTRDIVAALIEARFDISFTPKWAGPGCISDGVGRSRGKRGNPLVPVHVSSIDSRTGRPSVALSRT
jgi:transposase